MSDLQYSRPAGLSPWGKCSERVQAMVPEIAALELRKRAAESGVTESELTRMVLMRFLYGDAMVEASLVAHYRSMVGKHSGAQG